MILRVATAACALVILASALVPAGAGVPIPGGGWDKPSHFVGFALQAALLLLCLRQAGVSRAKAVGLTLALACGYGILTEGLQAFVPGRIASWQDLLADGLGAALGVAPAAVLRWENTHGETPHSADQ